MTATTPSLEEYVEANPPRGKCAVCRSKHRTDIEKAYRVKGPDCLARVLGWLEEYHRADLVPETSLRQHFKRGHHEQD